jgi:hypothetical protein
VKIPHLSADDNDRPGFVAVQPRFSRSLFGSVIISAEIALEIEAGTP